MRLLSIIYVFFLVACATPSVSHAPTIVAQIDQSVEPLAVDAGAIPVGKIGAADLEPVTKKIDELVDGGAKTVTLRINSPGGSVDDGIEFVQKLESYQRKGTKFVCIADGTAASMALYVLQGCDERLMTKRTTLMGHEPSFSNFGGNRFNLQEGMHILKLTADNMAEFIGRRLTIGVDGYKKKTRNKNWWFDYKEALEVTAVDRVIEPEEIPYIYELEKPKNDMFQLLFR